MRLSVLTVALSLLFAAHAEAATRTVYFSQTGRNVTYEKGLGSAVTSECRINVQNPSSSAQTIEVFATASATGHFASTAPHSTTPGTPVSLAANGGQQTYTLTFPAFAAGQATRQQQLLCTGRIVVTDNNDSAPGYIIAGGSLTSFTTSGTLQTAGAVMGSSAGGGTAIFTQIPIGINRNKPF